ncbi:MAG: hypothetical protein ACK2U5_10600 [Candidatus Promineifilaceae bacterium]|jgi:hypothetical protein
MNWNAIGNWADEMDKKVREERKFRIKVAVKHYGLDYLDIVGDKEVEDNLLTRYEEEGLEWPPMPEPKEEDES